MNNLGNPDVVIVGGGIGGSALAAVLPREGIAATIIEKSTVHVDRVRGEWVSPWGLAEVQRLGLYDTQLAAGGHHVRRHVPYGEGVSIDEAYAEQMGLVALAGALQMKSPLCMRIRICAMCSTPRPPPPVCNCCGALAT